MRVITVAPTDNMIAYSNPNMSSTDPEPRAQAGHRLPLANCSGLLSMRCGHVHEKCLGYKSS